jgi:hypothetical protein
LELRVHTISPDINGNINLPNNIAKVDTTGIDYPVDVVQRGLRLFNIDDNTYVFTRPIKLQLYVILDFPDLNATVKEYIVATAAMLLQQRILGSMEIDAPLKAKAKAAFEELVRDEVEISDPNMLYDSADTASMLQRGNWGSTGGWWF